MQFPDARILVFAKAPRPGAVKTRLIPALGAEGAADLHAALVRRTLDAATTTGLCPVELWCAPDHEDAFFADCTRHYPLTLHNQQGPDLGARMRHALDEVLGHAKCAVLVGSDCPALSAELLTEVMEALHGARCDAVLTPALDGGYVLIGLRRKGDWLFDDIAWGSAGVLEATRQRLRKAGWQWLETPALPDIDAPEDLDALPETLNPLRD